MFDGSRMYSRLRLSKRVATVAAIGLSMLAAACGGSESTIADTPSSEVRSTQALLAQARSAPAPAGVEEQVYQELLDELERVLVERGVSHVVSAPPSGAENLIADLTYTDNDLDSYSLSWSYTNSGDYDQNSEVNVADLTAIGQNFGKSAGDPDWDSSAQRADGDGDGFVTVADITPIGRHFGENVGGYNVYRRIDGDQEPELLGSVAFDSIADPSQPVEFEVEHQLDELADFHSEEAPIFSVIPFDNQGEEPADTSEAAMVTGDTIVLYSSSYIDDYHKLSWSAPPAGADGIQPAVSDWIHSRATQLTPDLQPPPRPDQASYEFSGRAMPQSMEARFNLSTGAGKIALRSEDGSLLSRYRGGEGAFALRLTEDVASKAPFSPDSLAATPYVIINTDGAMVSTEEFKVGETDFSGEMSEVQTKIGVFFPDDPVKVSGLAPGGLPEWAEKWCLIKDAVGELEDLQEY